MMRFLFVLIPLLFAAPSPAQTLRVLTEQWAPYNDLVDDQATGLSVEMVEALLKEARISANIEFLPWNRAYRIALETPNVLLFTIARTVNREANFNWLFKVAPREIWLYRLAERNDIDVKILDDARQYWVGTGAKNDAITQELISAGFSTKLDMVHGAYTEPQNVQKLFFKRVDLIVGTPLGLAYSCRRAGLDFGQITPVLRIGGEQSGNPGYWVALSLGSDQKLTQELRRAAKKLESQGTFSALREKHLR